jgi:signal peptidase II
MHLMKEAAICARTEAEPLPPKARRSHWILFAGLAIAVSALDLWSKHFIFRLLEATVSQEDGFRRWRVTSQASREIVPGFFNLEASVNPGAFNGWFGEHTALLTVLSAGALLVIAWFLRSHLRGPGPHRLWFTAALGLLWGGTFGNLYDRAAYGYVRDFVKWFHPWGGAPGASPVWPLSSMFDGRDLVWPNFNIADSAICVGVGILFVLILLESTRRRAGEAAAGPAAS